MSVVSEAETMGGREFVRQWHSRNDPQKCGTTPCGRPASCVAHGSVQKSAGPGRKDLIAARYISS